MMDMIIKCVAIIYIISIARKNMKKQFKNTILLHDMVMEIFMKQDTEREDSYSDPLHLTESLQYKPKPL